MSNKKFYLLGNIKLTIETNGFPKGFILKRELTLKESKYILQNLLGIVIGTREDFDDIEEYNNYNKQLCKDVNNWLVGNNCDEVIAEYAYDCSDEQLGLLNMIPIAAYLVKKGII